ncbi:MAG TPA: DUF2950 family protein [Candidatus Limnocylindria bacterium]|jgi:hypothetical protein|nr:DUF2950 family protein [Candidatus Limnocylindria bacterium]
MKIVNRSIDAPARLFRLLAMALMVVAGGISSIFLQAAAPKAEEAQTAVAQRTFESPEEAVKALRAAAESGDKATLLELFGPVFRDLMTGDEVQDANNAKRFAVVLGQGCLPVNEGENKVALEIGTNNWPMPIPLVREGGKWRFDTAAGKEAIVDRHIGKDELHAIGVCRAYVMAQRRYAELNPGQEGKANYALKFKSSPGRKDGLYWPVGENEPLSPFGALVAEAHAEGYSSHGGTNRHPFHGYYFTILTRQGKAAPGGRMNYVNHGNLTGGFALVAYPENWGRSGIMTFVVNQDGRVYQQNLGPKTSHIAGAMKEYNPDGNWALVNDDGVPNPVYEK